VPQDLWEIILAFYNNNADKEKIEEFTTGYTIVNFWDAPSYMTSFEDPDIPEAANVKQKIWDGVRPIIEEWVGRPVYETSLYGIRKYTHGAILAPRKNENTFNVAHFFLSHTFTPHTAALILSLNDFGTFIVRR
jgi:hypothetical protein